MKQSLKTYFIDPVAQVAGVLDTDSHKVALIAPPTRTDEHWSAGSFVFRYKDAVPYVCNNDSEALKQLEALRACTVALDFWLMLLDKNISETTKELIAIELAELFVSDAVYEYVQNILFSAPMPREADTEFIAAQLHDERSASFARKLLIGQDRVRTLYLTWIGMKDDPLVKATGYAELTGRLIRASIFRKLATQAQTQVDVETLKPKVILEAQSICDPRVALKLINEWMQHLPPGTPSERDATTTRTIPEYDPDFDQRGLRKPSNTTSVHALFQRAETEVINIAQLYTEGKDALATQCMEELIERQSEESPEYVVKSLCNIASRTSDAGLFDKSLNCLKRALEQPIGLDAVLYIQIGNELRRLREFENALSCYKEAQKLDDGSKSASIRDEIIRLSMAKGEYTQALNQFLNIADIYDQPGTLASLGTLHRKMGDLRDARKCYHRVLELRQGWEEVAQAGLAEVAKQSGKLHRAIQIYHEVLRAPLDTAPQRVYRLALAHLFRMTGQKFKSIELLTHILNDSPKDYEAHFQLAKCYLLEGCTVQAREHSTFARVPDLKGISYDLYRLAMSVTPSLQGAQEATTHYGSPNEYLPEDRGLVGCRNALTLITENCYQSAIEALEGIEFVDKGHHDFGVVLRFHASKRLDSEFNHRDNSSICRIMKRGFTPLRKAAIEIAGGNFDQALEQESDFCLRIA